MNQDSIVRFFIVDDDPVHAMLCRFHIEQLLEMARVLHFSNAFTAIDYIRYFNINESAAGHEMNIILLNLNMPVMSGWDFLEIYEALPGNIRERITLYFLSASVDPNDMERARSSASVKGFLVKPITEAVIKQILSGSYKN